MPEGPSGRISTTSPAVVGGEGGTDGNRISIRISSSPSAQNFNPTEAILATLQLIPMPCSKDGRLVMCREEIERNVSFIRSFTRSSNQRSGITSSASSSGLLLRRKSKSQTGLSDLQGKTSASAFYDLDELRSIQRQLQNFPSLDELRRNPLQSLAPPAAPAVSSSRASSTSNNNRRSPSPATSESSRDAANTSSNKPPHRPPSKSRSIEDYALAILQILKVCDTK